MALVFNPWGVYGVAVAVALWGLAVLVFSRRPDRYQNRLLALVLAVDGFVAFWAWGAMYLTDSATTAYAAQMSNIVAWGLSLPCYLALVSTLDSPLAVPFRTRIGRFILVAGALAWSSYQLLAPNVFVLDMAWMPFGAWVGVLGPGGFWQSMATIAVFVYGTIAALTAVHRARPKTAARGQAWAFVAAFATRDLGVSALLAFYFVYPVPWIPVFADTVGFPTTYLASAILLAYGILKTQLFDIDIKIKVAISRSTVAAVFAGSVFVVSELIEQLLGVEQLVPAILAAGLIALAMRPLARAGERVANLLMPGVQDTEAYRGRRAREIYAAAIESATADGGITPRERSMLTTLQKELGLDAADVLALERDASAARRVG